jgi:hypothetical protein
MTIDILIKFSMVNLILPELNIIDKLEDKRYWSSWTLVGLLEIRILNVVFFCFFFWFFVVFFNI